MAGALLSGIAAEVVRGVFEIGDVSEPEAHFLHRGLGLLTPLWAELLQDGGDPTSSWQRLEKLWALLDMPLVRIAEERSAGQLAEFTTDELCRFVECLFSDSKLRQTVLKSLRAHH
jgi:hypothetical protein